MGGTSKEGVLRSRERSRERPDSLLEGFNPCSRYAQTGVYSFFDVIEYSVVFGLVE
jgi:hypothetical protein